MVNGELTREGADLLPVLGNVSGNRHRLSVGFSAHANNAPRDKRQRRAFEHHSNSPIETTLDGSSGPGRSEWIAANTSSIWRTAPLSETEAISKLVCADTRLYSRANSSAPFRIFGSLPFNRRR